MREIEFKGKMKNRDEWVNGFYFQRCGAHFILTNTFYVNGTLKTLSQYTGFKDQEEDKIYENDNCFVDDKEYIVTWVEDYAGFAFIGSGHDDELFFEDTLKDNIKIIEVK